ncbi:hypothetical protein DID80_07985, partial [Candidatus Marinamargulisbacteria bacterium SCGC AAA071-K20]
MAGVGNLGSGFYAQNNERGELKKVGHTLVDKILIKGPTTQDIPSLEALRDDFDPSLLFAMPDMDFGNLFVQIDVLRAGLDEIISTLKDLVPKSSSPTSVTHASQIHMQVDDGNIGGYEPTFMRKDGSGGLRSEIVDSALKSASTAGDIASLGDLQHGLETIKREANSGMITLKASEMKSLDTYLSKLEQAIKRLLPSDVHVQARGGAGGAGAGAEDGWVAYDPSLFGPDVSVTPSSGLRSSSPSSSSGGSDLSVASMYISSDEDVSKLVESPASGVVSVLGCGNCLIDAICGDKVTEAGDIQSSKEARPQIFDDIKEGVRRGRSIRAEEKVNLEAFISKYEENITSQESESLEVYLTEAPEYKSALAASKDLALTEKYTLTAINLLRECSSSKVALNSVFTKLGDIKFDGRNAAKAAMTKREGRGAGPAKAGDSDLIKLLKNNRDQLNSGWKTKNPGDNSHFENFDTLLKIKEACAELELTADGSITDADREQLASFKNLLEVESALAEGEIPSSEFPMVRFYESL